LGGGVTPPVGLLTNIDDANCNGSYISPASSENGHLATARLVPAAYPATVGKVRYQIVTNSVCISPAHRVDVFVASSAAPPATPNVIESINVPANAEGPDHKIELTLTNPITLNTGESLFVAIEQKYVSPLDKTCIAACGGSSAIADRNYWSNSPNAPYPWATLASFGLNYNYVVEAYP
ncbi:MAG: hypothetical protein KC731_36110, partial [Myxococcales bacterium]|nr:hypothetical protein [Myxococcales bacterium]